MQRTFFRHRGGLAVTICLALATGQGRADDKNKLKADPAKGGVEAGTKVVVRDANGAARAAAANLVVNTASPPFVNPKTRAGLVKWHPDFETACAASRKSNKPVLLFQMMGKLDDEFC